MSKFAEVTKITMAEFGLQESELPKLRTMTEQEKAWFLHKNLKNLQVRNGFGATVRSAGKCTTISASMDAFYSAEEEKFIRYTNHCLSGEKQRL